MDIFTVNVLVEIEQVNLEQGLGAIKRRARADTGDSIFRPSRQTLHSYRKNAHHRALFAPQVHVGRWKTQRPAKLFAQDDLP